MNVSGGNVDKCEAQLRAPLERLQLQPGCAAQLSLFSSLEAGPLDP